MVYVYNMPTQTTNEDLEQVFAPLHVSIKVNTFKLHTRNPCFSR